MLCGSSPAIDVAFRQNIGMLLTRRVKTWQGTACRDCGRSMGRKLQNLTLATGWWGLISFFTNIGIVIGNASTLGHLRRLAPAPRPAGAPAPGRSVFLRPGFLVAPGIIGAIALVGALQPDKPGWSQGSCVTIASGKAVPVACSAAHDGKITSVVASGNDCPFSARGSVVIGDRRYCVSND